jgi:hypothetical protein
VKQLVWSLPLAFLVACGSSTGTGDTDGPSGEGGKASSTTSSTSAASTSTGSSSGLTEAQRIDVFCEKTLLAQCGNWFTSKDQCVGIMQKTKSEICQAKWEAETDCLGQTQASDWACTGIGEPAIAGTTCRDQYGFGSYCRIAVANPDCYGAACKYDADCSGGANCNDATEHCVKSTAQCGALPCKYDADCSSDFKCNDALGQCVRP